MKLVFFSERLQRQRVALTFLPGSTAPRWRRMKPNASAARLGDIKNLDGVLEAAVQSLWAGNTVSYLPTTAKSILGVLGSIGGESHRVRRDESLSVVNDGVACAQL